MTAAAAAAGRAVCVSLSIERIMRGTCGYGYDYEPAGLHKYEKGRGENFMKHLGAQQKRKYKWGRKEMGS